MAAICLLIALVKRIKEKRQKEMKMRLREKRCTLREEDPFELPENEFRRLYRFPKHLCRAIVSEVAPFLKQPKRSTGISRDRKVLAALRFFAVGCYQRPIGQDMNIAMSQAVISRVINEVAKAIVRNLAGRYIKFPTTRQEITENQRKFQEAHDFPGVIGCVDGTHVHIISPERFREHVYYSVRKSAHTKNVQIICDSDLKILNINARYGGTAHDSYVWNNSVINRFLKHRDDMGEFPSAWLLGDSGYSQLPWLMTPYMSPESPVQERYNVKHKIARSVVERCIGVLKSRFRCLSRQRVLMYSPEVAGTIINACAVLHNFLIEEDLPLPTEEEICIVRDDEEEDNEEEDNEEQENDPNHQEDIRSLLYRGRLVREETANSLN